MEYVDSDSSKCSYTSSADPQAHHTIHYIELVRSQILGILPPSSGSRDMPHLMPFNCSNAPPKLLLARSSIEGWIPEKFSTLGVS